MSGRGLAALAIALIAVVALYLLWRSDRTAPATDAGPVLFDTRPERVVAIEVDAAEGAWRVERRGTGWVLSAPFPAEASSLAVEAALADILGARVGRTIEEAAAEPVRFGLQPPRATVRLEVAHGRPLPTAAIGSLAPTGGQRYATFDGARVFLVDGRVLDAAARRPEHLRERRLVPASPGEVLAIRVDPPRASAFRIERREAGWVLTEPFLDRVDDGAAERLAQSLGGLTVEQFGAAEGAWDRATRLDVETADARWTVRIGSAAGAAGVPARRDDADVEGFVPLAATEPFEITAWDVRDHRLVSMDPSTVVDARWTWRDGSSRTLREGSGTTWRVIRTGDKDRSIAGTVIEDILARLAVARAIAPEDPAILADHEPTRAVILRSASGAEGTLELFAANDRADVWVARSTWRPGLAFVVERESVPLPDAESALIAGERAR